MTTSDPGKPSVGVIGLGAMGMPMAHRLVEAGYEVVCHDIATSAVDRLVEEGARGADSPAALAEQVDIVLTMLPKASHVRKVVLGERGVVHGAHDGSTVIDASTVYPQVIEEVAATLEPRGAAVLGVGVSGTPSLAWEGNLTLMIGGRESAVDKIAPPLEVLCRTLVYTGSYVGSAKVMKLANNMVSAVSMAAVAEAFQMARKAGISPRVAHETMMAGWGRCRNLEMRPPAPGVVAGSPADDGYATDFSVDYMIKDLDYALRTANMYRTSLSVAAAAHQLYVTASAHGDGDRDISVIGRTIGLLSGDASEPNG